MNVSEGGLGILSEARTPPKGTELTIYYPLTANTDSGYVTLHAVVRWCIDGMSGSGGGIGLQILKIDDGEDGARWRGYVQSEAEGGFILEVNQDGMIDPHAGEVPGHPGLRRRPRVAAR